MQIGISLLGIDSVQAPTDARLAAWDRVGDLFSAAAYESMTTEHRLEELPGLARRMLDGGVAGRVVINPRDLPT